jgi:hypothetical protein
MRTYKLTKKTSLFAYAIFYLFKNKSIQINFIFISHLFTLKSEILATKLLDQLKIVHNIFFA